MTTPADFTVARTLATKLLTTCQPNEYWDDLEALTMEQARALDAIVFECHTCNHWFPVAEAREIVGQFYCRDCA